MNFFRDASWKAPFFILGVVFVVYANSLWNGLTFDDHALVEDNRVISAPTTHSVHKDRRDLYTALYIQRLLL